MLRLALQQAELWLLCRKFFAAGLLSQGVRAGGSIVAKKKRRQNRRFLISLRSGAIGYCAIGLPLPPCRAIFELKGESPCLGSSTTTTVPCFTRL